MSQPWPCYPVKPPPRGEDLPYDDGVPLESEMHVLQMTLLKESLDRGWADRDDYYAGCNMFVYYSELQSKKNDFRGPDVFVVLHTKKKIRRSWVVWEEDGRRPNVVIEITSPSTEAFDRGQKKGIYAHILGVAEYFLYDPFEKRLEGYKLNIDRSEYEPMQPDERGRVRSDQLGLWLGVLPGRYLTQEELWLRWIDDEGNVLPCGDDLAANAQAGAQQAQAEAQQAQAEAQQAQAEAQQAQAEAQQAQAEAQQARERLIAAGRALVAAGKQPAEVALMLGIGVGELSTDGW